MMIDKRQVEPLRRRPARRTLSVLTVGLTLTAFAVAGWLAAPASQAATAPAAPLWTGTWAASPQTGSTTFNLQTLRQIVHTSISGTSARIQLSNAFGTQPVTISDVHIAQRSSGSSITASTDRKITFSSAASTTIPAGGTAVSDTASFAVAASSDVAVSFYVPQSTGGATFHSTGEQTNYVAAGDVSGNATITATRTSNDYYLLANLDVQNSAAKGSVVALGASITDGVASAANTNHRYTNLLSNRLLAGGRTVGVLNQGISGNRLLVDGSGQSALNRFNRDVLSQPGVRWVIFADDPINDVGDNRPVPTTSQLTTALQQLISRAHQSGVRFLCATLTPFDGASYWTSAGETSREGYDTFVRSASSGCDGVVDIDTATHDPANPTRYLPAYDSGDHLHPNDAGMQAMANAVNLSLFDTVTATTTVSLRAHADSEYVCADSGGALPLIANRTAIGAWETFDMVDEGSGNVALRAHANDKFVTAPSAGTQPLIAKSAEVSTWEKFHLVHNSDGSVSLQALADNQYVTAGANPLIANRTAIGTSEKFDLIND
jgi:lysophospholipase L1-like esterase